MLSIIRNKRDIANQIYQQMTTKGNFYFSISHLNEKINGVSKFNYQIRYTFSDEKDLYDDFDGRITDTLFKNIIKGIHNCAKFHSLPELKFARLLEYDEDVIKWLRPSKNEFNLYYNKSNKYEPDFVVELNDVIHLIEVKGEDKINSADVIAKKERAKSYCELASQWFKEHNLKPWKYVLIPATKIREDVSYKELVKNFIE